MKPTLLVLAAGMASRYGSLKQVDKYGVSGESIIDYSIYDAIKAGFGKVVFIIRRSMETDFKATFAEKFGDKIVVDYVFQEINIVPEGVQISPERFKPWGTGHALLVAHEKVKEPFAVINADDFYGYESFKIIADFLSGLSADSKSYCIVGYQLTNTLSENGSVSRGVCEVDNDNNVLQIVERTRVYQEGTQLYYEDETGKHKMSGNEKASMNLMGFTPAVFENFKEDFEIFIRERGTDLKAEMFLSDVVNKIIATKVAKVCNLDTPAKWFGVTYKEDKPIVIQRLKELVEKGVYPAQLWKS